VQPLSPIFIKNLEYPKKTIVRVSTQLLFVFGLIVLFAVPGNKYTWMQDVEPSITACTI